MLRRVGPVAGPGRREDAFQQRLQGERGLRRKGMAGVPLCMPHAFLLRGERANRMKTACCGGREGLRLWL